MNAIHYDTLVFVITDNQCNRQVLICGKFLKCASVWQHVMWNISRCIFGANSLNKGTAECYQDNGPCKLS